MGLRTSLSFQSWRGRVASAPLIVLALAGCNEAMPSRDTGIAIEVAPLSLPGVKDAKYRVQVVNAAGDTVADLAGLTADRFGNGSGSFAYVAPCDTSDGGMNTVTLVLEDLYEGDGATAAIDRDSYVNPCGSAGATGAAGDDINWDGFACTRTVLCKENADVPVTFNLVIVRDAVQGFFDVAVNFDDIFCSAKVDCVPALLHDPRAVPSARGPTAVVAFACTAGPGQDTTLYMNDFSITCGAPNPRTIYVDPALGPGQHGPAPAAAPALFETATYIGQEQLPDLDKCYWNNAFGLDLAALGPNCTLHGRATAAATPFSAPPNTTPDNTHYPVVSFEVPLTGASGDNVCDDAPHPLDGGNGVATIYGAIEGERFTHAMRCGTTPISTGRVACGSEALPFTFTETAEGVVVRAAASAPSPSYDLAPGLHIQSCCGDACCN